MFQKLYLLLIVVTKEDKLFVIQVGYTGFVASMTGNFPA